MIPLLVSILFLSLGAALCVGFLYADSRTELKPQKAKVVQLKRKHKRSRR